MQDFKNHATRQPLDKKYQKKIVPNAKGKFRAAAPRPSPSPRRVRERSSGAFFNFWTPHMFVESGYKWVLGIVTFGCTLWLLVGVVGQSFSFFQQPPPHQMYLNGYRTLSPASIYETIGMGSDVKFNEISPYQMANRLNQHPKVAQAQIRRLFPDFLAISLKERQPYIFLHTKGFYYLLDESFYPIEKAAVFENFDHPIFTGIAPSQVQLGVPVSSSALEKGAQFFDAMRQSSLDWKNIAELDVGDAFNLKVRLRHPAVLVQLGQGDYLEKMQTYEKIVTRLQQSGKPFHSVDLRYKNKAIVQL